MRAAKIRRRLLTIPALYVGAVVLTVLFPALLIVAIGIDLVRWLGSRTPFMATRVVVFVWVYAFAGVFGVTAMALSWVLTGFGTSKNVLARHAYVVQRRWVAIVIGSGIRLLRLKIRFESDVPLSGPFLLFSRHASLLDTLLPELLVGRPNRIKLRYVLKQELLSDPTFDVGGNRVPNHFVDRAATDPRVELRGLRDLATDLPIDGGVLIFPEGTRFTPERRARLIDAQTEPAARADAEALRHVLPPQAGGAVALMAAAGNDVDIVVLAHHGLEGLAKLSNAWTGETVGNTVSVKAWRYPASSLPTTRKERARWLYEQWQVIDEWLETQNSLAPADHR